MLNGNSAIIPKIQKEVNREKSSTFNASVSRLQVLVGKSYLDMVCRKKDPLALYKL